MYLDILFDIRQAELADLDLFLRHEGENCLTFPIALAVIFIRNTIKGGTYLNPW